jgi:CHAD domain-containing protein
MSKEVVTNRSTSLLVDTLEKRWKTYRNELKRCHKEPGEEAIHDLRVATRRMLALVDMLRVLSPHPRLGKLRSVFKNQLDSLDDLRDTQVMLVEVSETSSDLPELAPFQEYLAKREKRLLKSTAKAIKSFNTTNIRKRLDATRKALFKAENGNNPKKELLQIVDDAYGTTLRRYRKIDSAKPGTIHRTRIAFKKFRYMVELIHPLVKDFPEDNFKQMHEYQGMMGDLQDVEIFVSVFDDFADKDASYDPNPVRQFYEQRHTEVINIFVEDMHQINTFWRPTTESPFPWKIGHRLEKPTKPLPDQEEDANGKQVEAEQEAQ